MLQKNQIVPLVITDITDQAFGVGKIDGFAVFVPETAVGDQILARIVKTHKSYAYAIVEELRQPGPDRIQPDCPVYHRCGGCSFRHISYEAECAIKQNWLIQHFRRIGSISTPPEPFVPAKTADRYRNKALYPTGKDQNGNVAIGFFARRSHRIVEHAGCLLQPACFGTIQSAVKTFLTNYNISVYDENSHTGLVRHLLLRQGTKSGEILVCLVLNGDKLPHQEAFVEALLQTGETITSICINRNTKRTNVALGPDTRTIFGADTIKDTLSGFELSLSPQSFYQVNHAQAQTLYAIAADFAGLTGQEILLDLYCGAGTIGLSMAQNAGQIIGVEIVAQAVENAVENAKTAGIKNARFLCADAAKAAEILKSEGLRPDVVVMDPPRKGCDAAVLQTVQQMNPRKIVMISCNGATAARDIALLQNLGYTLQKWRGVDMFPRTAHVECVVLMTRKDK